jgi:hypothetical protein
MIKFFEKRVPLWVGVLSMLVAIVSGIIYEFGGKNEAFLNFGRFAASIAIVLIGAEIIYLVIREISGK